MDGLLLVIIAVKIVRLYQQQIDSSKKETPVELLSQKFKAAGLSREKCRTPQATEQIIARSPQRNITNQNMSALRNLFVQENPPG